MTNSYQFDDVRVEPHTFKVLKAGTPVLLEPKEFLLLVFLIENRDRLVEKREILDTIWKDVAVTENALTREVGKLRKSLGDDAKSAKYIQTVHTRGYRFIAPVEIIDQSQEVGQPVPAAQPQPAGSPRKRSAWTIPAIAIGVIFVLLAAAVLPHRNVAAGKTWNKPAVVNLAVLPFQSLGAGSNDQYAGLAMADALITKLSGSNRLSVQPTSTVLHFVNTSENSLAIGRSMKVDYVLEGKVQTQNDRVRVTVQLLCIACDKASQWAGSFDERSGDIFQVQDSISEKVVSALTLELTGEQRERMMKHATTNKDAQLAYVKGKFFILRDTRESLDKATEYFRLAVDRDPEYASAWAQLSDCYRRQEWYGAAPSQVMEKTRAAAKKAIALDDTESYGHSMAGFVAFQYDWDFKTAEREYQRALEIRPSFVHQWHARLLLATNRRDAAEMEYRHFLSAAPFMMAGKTNIGQFYLLTNQYDQAETQFRDTIELEPSYAPSHEMLGLVYEQKGRTDKAIEELQKAVQLSHGFVGLASLGYLQATQGDKTEVENTLQEMAAQSKQRYVSPFEYALVHAGMRQTAKALEDLERGYAERSLSAQSLRFDPRLNKVRTDPAYRDFVKRIGLPF